MNYTFNTEYSAFKRDIIDKGYAARVPNKDLGRDNSKVRYLPHHGVYYPKKHKLIAVFNFVALYQGTIRKNKLLQGPNLTSTLLGIITK